MRKLILVLLLLSACQFMPVQKGIPVPPEIRVGTSALDVTFAPGSMAGVYMCQQGEVFLFLKNSGAFDIKGGKYSWILEEQYLAPVDSAVGEFSLLGKSSYYPVGGVNQTSFKFESVDLPEQSASYDTTLIFQACYPYKTTAGVPVCIDPDVRGINKNKPCTAKPVSLNGGQGGPVSVTKVSSVMAPEGDMVRPYFEISIQNLGTGTVFAKDAVMLACLRGPGSLNISEVIVRAEVQGNELVCTPGVVRLDPAKEATVICKFAEAKYGVDSGTFSSILLVELDYGYKDVVAWPVAITRLPSQTPCPVRAY